MMQSKAKITLAVLTSSLLVILIAVYLWQAGPQSRQAAPPPGPPEKITIGTALNLLSGLLYIIKDQGYDKAQGLEVDIKACPAGIDAVTDLRAGRVDLACCADFLLVSQIFAGAANLRCLAIFSTAANFELIVRRDRGINRPEDLRGKTIGVPQTHSARFFLGRFLSFNGISLKELNLVDVRPGDLDDALVAGRVDAVVAWDERFYDTMQKMGNNAFSWPVHEGQDLFWLLVSREEVVKKRGGALEKLLRALAQAADFRKRQPEAGRAIIARWAKIPLADLQAGKYPIKYDLFLDQLLLLAMEDQARWMIKNKLTDQTRIPNYLDYLAADPLAGVDPKAVRIIIPKGTK